VPNVTFRNWGRTIKAGPLANLRDVARLAGISLHNGASKLTNCHGNGVCGTCRVVVEPVEALTPPTRRERLHGCTGPFRLSCQARVMTRDLSVVKMAGFLGKGRDPVRIPGVSTDLGATSAAAASATD
jgi:ferredoxin